MNREILFRAKRIGRKSGHWYRSEYRNGQWVYGLITKQYTEEWRDMFYDEMTDIHGISGIDIDRNTIGQFTGLLDKNSNKIFEDDIVYNGVFKARVEFINGRFAPFGGDAFFADECEVIGNIYDK